MSPQWPAESSTKRWCLTGVGEEQNHRRSYNSSRAAGNPRRSLLQELSISPARKKFDIPQPSDSNIKTTGQFAESSTSTALEHSVPVPYSIMRLEHCIVASTTKYQRVNTATSFFVSQSHCWNDAATPFMGIVSFQTRTKQSLSRCSHCIQ